MQGLTAKCRGGATFNVVDLRAFVSDDERPFKLPHVFAVDPEIGLQRIFNLYTRRDINKTPATPSGTVECGELIIRRGDDGPEVFLHQVRVLFDSSIRIKENYALFRQLVHDVMVNHLGVVLCADSGEELPFGFGNTEPVKGFLDVVRYIVPALFAPVRGFDVVVNVVKIEL